MTTGKKTALLWFRQDLRLDDNPALRYACENNYQITPIYILDDENAQDWKIGAASRWWLHESLSSLNQSLSGSLQCHKGNAEKIIPELIKDTYAQAIFWNRCYEPWRIARDKKIKDTLTTSGIEAKSFNASLLWEPWDVLKDDGTPYKVFTPYYRKGCLSRPAPKTPEDPPDKISFAATKDDASLSLQALNLLPKIKWYEQMAREWHPGETGARKRLEHFITNGLKGYKEGRNFPMRDNVSRLSPHLHFGEISPCRVWHAARAAALPLAAENDVDHFCSELGWREFSHYLLYHWPQIPTEPLQKNFAAFPWDQNDAALLAWQRGNTGIPIVDAGMRELWQTGWMHNRVRMIVASFLIKNLLIHWHEGEKWFWDCLVDADLAANAASWQWVAGCGADAAPYFRIFNPVTQGERFDPDGAYVRRYVPEIAHMPDKFIHQPWESPNPPADYPSPIVDLKTSRQRALDAFAQIKN